MEALNHTQHVLAIGWWLAVAFCILLYVVLDGADLGAGIFSLFLPDGDERGAIMQAMAGTWDANETWLVVAGGILFGSFPFAYGSAFSYLMIPLAIVLWGIITRAVALEPPGSSVAAAHVDHQKRQVAVRRHEHERRVRGGVGAVVLETATARRTVALLIQDRSLRAA